MNRFFGKSENITGKQIKIDGSDFNHMKHVLRLAAGEEVIVNGGNNQEYRCRIRSYEKDTVLLDIVETTDADRELPARIHIFQGLPKGDKMELVIQKCIELGAYEIIPVSMKRCVVKLDEKKAAQKTVRWQAISESAAKQSGRGIIPNVHEVMSFPQALAYAAKMEMGLIPYELAQGMETMKQAIAGVHADMDIAVFIGPEGGIDLEEIEAAVSQGIIPVSLGKRILRTETAGIMVMSLMMYHLEIQE